MNKLPYSLLIATSLLISNPTQAQSSNKINNDQNTIEMIDNSDILSNITKRTWIEIPEIYKKKLEDFFSTNRAMKNSKLAKFTENFIVEQMDKNPWIDEKSRLIFMLDCVHEKHTWKNIYDWDDWNEKMLNDFENFLDDIEKAWNNYVQLFEIYLQNLSADAEKKINESKKKIKEYDEQSAELDKQSAELDKQSAKNREIIEKNIKKRFMEDVPDFYQKYITNPQVITQNDIDFMRKSTKSFIDDCEKYWHDYKALMLEAVWNKRKVEEMLKFYGVE